MLDHTGMTRPQRQAVGIDVGIRGLTSPEDVARRLRISISPYVVLHGYWNRSMALIARAEVVAALDQCSETGEGMDRRRLGATVPFPLSRRFEADPYLLEVARSHLRRRVNVKAQAGLTLAGECSGGGWHKDTMTRGIKALMYLDDVDSSNGPFAMLRNYHGQNLAWSPDAVSGALRRLNSSVVDAACAKSRARVDELHASMGSVIIFEISSAHRGMPCRRGQRASLTNYYKVMKRNTTCASGRTASGPFVRG